MNIKLTIPPEQTGLKNYVDYRNCVIATALKSIGYIDVVVTPHSWKAAKIKNFFFFKIIRNYTGTIDEVTDTLAYKLSEFRQTEPVTILINRD